MARIVRLLLLSLLLPVTAKAACNLQISMSCGTFAGGKTTSCSTTTLNAGNASCSGEYIAAAFGAGTAAQMQIRNFRTDLGLDACFGSGDFPVEGDPGVFGFCSGLATLPAGGSFHSSFDVVLAANAPASLPLIALTGVYDLETGEELGFVYTFNETVIPTCTPTISAPPVTQSGSDYTVTWSAVSDANATFEIQESTSADFSNAVTSTTSAQSKTFRHDVTGNTTYYYRVRATSCGGTNVTTFSESASTIVQAPLPPQSSKGADVVVPFGSTTPVRIPIHIDAPSADVAFTASVDKPYLSVSPSSGTIPPGGTTVTVTANPSALPPGANTGTLNVTSAGGASLAKTPVSVSLVTPVTPGGKSLPPGNALIIPVVTHVNGAAGPFQSDVRLTNGSAAEIKYDLTFTPSGSDGTKVGRKTQITVAPGQSIALNDIVKDFFGFGATGQPNDSGFGVLEIRPVNNSSPLTYASSRTYANTSAGTFGQFIAAVPFDRFATNAASLVPVPGLPSGGPPILSLQQIAQSSKFRTNLGLVEGSGTPASGNIRVFDDLGNLLKTIGYSLQPGEHRQINSFLAMNGVTLEDGRIEITIDSETGAITAYASVLDNITTDPLAVMPVQASAVSASRYVLPGMADLNNGAANFHSDIRVFNGGSTSATVNLTYYPQGQPGNAKTATPITIPAGQVFAADNVLPGLFAATSTGGSIVMTTGGNTSLVATGRTYSIGANNGTFGQFIQGVTPAEGIGLGDRPLQVLQLEQSRAFRSNLGLAELSGNPAK
ncbi:MAG TPA: hypothetical protein VJ276_17780, partial [Thermoanaerobaculia bacterium]|nr:hypothetical protein [Thermoanaerobaculia bacterium]